MSETISMVTFTAPVNIALIKYWGKRNEQLILPVAGSLSITLNQDEMCAKTTIAVSEHFTEDRMWLNGEEVSLDNPRLVACLKEIHSRAAGGSSNKRLKQHLHIASVNNFPTAAGLASSAAGYACLVSALAKLFQVKGDISALARRGSGSACRSVYGGFVEWIRGECEDGSDSVARQVATQHHWPDLHVLVLVVHSGRKAVPSSAAMQRSVETSQFLHHWSKVCVPEQIAQLKEAIDKKDFAKLAELTMKGSNQLHALCLETYPPVTYMNDTSHAIVRLVHAYNALHSDVRVLYTFDAGPNACLVLRKCHVEEVCAFVNNFLPPPPCQDNYFRGLDVGQLKFKPEVYDPVTYSRFLKDTNIDVKPGAVKFIIHTKIGDGPRHVTNENEHLLGKNGMPKCTSQMKI